MKFNNPKVLADALSDLDIQPDPTKVIEVQDIIVPTILVASQSSTNTIPIEGQALTAITGSGLNNTVTLGTVPAGKKWRIRAFNHCGAVNNASITNAMESTLRANSVSISILRCGLGSTGFIAGVANATCLGQHYIEITAGQTVDMVCDQYINGDACVFYHELNA